MTYLYLYEGADQRLYIGIGDETTRAWEDHNEDAEALRAEPDTLVLQTPMPFSSRKDAEVAEAIAIHIAALAGIPVRSDNEDATEIVAQAVNRAGIKGTKHLVPAVFRKDGSIDFGTLRRTAIVVLKPESIDARGSLHGGRPVASFAARAESEWDLRKAKRKGYRPQRLLAILKKSQVVLGDWDLDPETPLHDDRFALADPTNDDPRGVKGMRLDLAGDHLGNLVTWSNDVRDAFGLRSHRQRQTTVPSFPTG